MAGKKYAEAKKKVAPGEKSLETAVDLMMESKFANFDETAEIAINLGVDPKHADQMVRGTVVLPNGLGKQVRVCVIAAGEKIKEAEEAGAEFVGGDDFVEKIQGGWTDFDAVVATPDMMKSVGKLGRILGPRGLMPNPKAGTVTFNVKEAVEDIKAGKVEFRVDKNGVIHAPFGKLSFTPEKLVQNAKSLIDAVVRAKPASAKGRYVRTVSVSSTMGPGIRVDVSQLSGK
ncbi:MAG: 50S ribosomal protein L1 [Acidobacteriota bacterium]|jgi:large subunit ribosomal protein L1